MKFIFVMQINIEVLFILGVHKQACPKYLKPRSLHIFAISAEKLGGQSVVFAC